jgi:hypothetical protein
MKKIIVSLLLLLFVQHLNAQTISSIHVKGVPDEPDTTIAVKRTVHIVVDTAAQFPGGEAEWKNFLKSTINTYKKSLKNDPKSKNGCTIQFIVDIDGKISEISVSNNLQDSEIAKVFTKALLNTPKWTPAKKNGEYVNSYVVRIIKLKN